MIVGIGCDIVDHDLTEILNWGSDISVLDRIFSKKELAIYFSKQNIKFLAGRLAAKEAILKCLGTGIQDGIALPDVQILELDSGKPTVDLQREAKRISYAMTITTWHISISHSCDRSIAFAIAETSF